MAKICLVDDDQAFRDSMKETLTDLGHEVAAATKVSSALNIFKIADATPFDVIFLDLRLPEINGLDGLSLIRVVPGYEDVPVILLTAHASGDNTIEAISRGAFDHLTKPLGRVDLERIIARATRVKSLSANHKTLAWTDLEETSFVGCSESIRAIQKQVGRIAASRASVLITGETGTGKEVVARSIHEHSGRDKSAFVAINCAAFSETLLESELFGHLPGAFTGAKSARIGVFEQAHCGTLFLDELGDMPFSTQTKILRVLETREVTPVGGTKALKLDVRIIAATHRNLVKLIDDGSFREDLYFRINVVDIDLPPLRERREDIALLAQHFLNQLVVKNKLKSAHLSDDAADKLSSHHWPGNIRELRNVIERALLIAQTGQIEADDIRFSLPSGRNVKGELGEKTNSCRVDLPSSLPTSVRELEKKTILRALELTHGNRAEAARRLGIQRQHLYAKLKSLQID